MRPLPESEGMEGVSGMNDPRSRQVRAETTMRTDRPASPGGDGLTTHAAVAECLSSTGEDNVQ